MDFESPDVEKDFPGLFASESVLKKCNESDYTNNCLKFTASPTYVNEVNQWNKEISDENHDKSFKKELISGKKKDKRDSKKDRGYAALEGESSADENTDSKSPSKSKKTKSFKFSTKKSEKREKSREKDGKDKEIEKDKKKDKEKKEKDKLKQKDKKKRHGEDLAEFNGDYPVFGVDLAIAVERSGCLDGVPIPLVVRNCIDCIHELGLPSEGLYKTVGGKSKVLAIKKAYNFREPVALKDLDVFISGCLLKMFLRELPEPLLTNGLLARFEEAGAIMEVDAREVELENLIQQLPFHSRILLSWLIVHFDTVTLYEKQNKLNAQSIAMTFSPVLQMSHRLLTAFLCHCKTLFPDTIIEKYVPPLAPGSSFPETSEEIAIELRKQESLLSQLHKEMSQGFVSKKREELLWEVQRIVTQLKRTLRILQRSQETNVMQRSLDEDAALYEINAVPDDSKKQIEKNEPLKKIEDLKEELSEAKVDDLEKPTKESREDESTESTGDSTESNVQKEIPNDDVKISKDSQVSPKSQGGGSDCLKNDWNASLLRLQIEREHLCKFQNTLEDRLDSERQMIDRLNEEIKNYRNEKNITSDAPELKLPIAPETKDEIAQLIEGNISLTKRKDELIRRIFDERLACLQLKVRIDMFNISGRV